MTPPAEDEPTSARQPPPFASTRWRKLLTRWSRRRPEQVTRNILSRVERVDKELSMPAKLWINFPCAFVAEPTFLTITTVISVSTYSGASAFLLLTRAFPQNVVTLGSDVYRAASCTIQRWKQCRLIYLTPGDPLAFQGLLLLIYDPSKSLPVSHFKLSILPEAHPSINCFQALDYFQTGRAHLLLVSRTPGVAGGAIGVITLEDVIGEIISEEIMDETDRYEDNQNKKQAKRLTNAAVMRGIVERERNMARQTPEQRTPLLPISPPAGTPPRGGYGTLSASYKH
ncbi:hypothetical protein EDD15DRAFT_2201955 [Pisolithus albus]|nr:hypothetical protein EDD15DRAFT_2201955 [Pisolithus albus]